MNMDNRKQLNMWPNRTKPFGRKPRNPRTFINRAGKRVSLNPPTPAKPANNSNRYTQLNINFNPFIPVPRRPVAPIDPRTYVSRSTGKVHTRAEKPSPQYWINPKYEEQKPKPLSESYNFLMSYYKSLEN